jgi:hypothetical protein
MIIWNYLERPYPNSLRRSEKAALSYHNDDKLFPKLYYKFPASLKLNCGSKEKVQFGLNFQKV